MQIAVCCSDETESRRICSLIEDISEKVQKRADPTVFRSEETFWPAFRQGGFRAVVVGYGDVRGFLCARRVREEDNACRVILLDDTEHYAIRALRIHLSDFLVRPLEDDRLRAALQRLLTE